MPPPYRPVSAPVLNPAPSPVFNPANGGAAGFGADIFFNRVIFASRRGVPLKMGNFVRVLSNFAPSPIVPASKLYTTSTVLSSGEGLKKRNFVGIMLNSSPFPAPYHFWLTSRSPPGSIPILHFALFNLHFAFFPAGPFFPVSGETQTGPGGLSGILTGPNALHGRYRFPKGSPVRMDPSGRGIPFRDIRTISPDIPGEVLNIYYS